MTKTVTIQQLREDMGATAAHMTDSELAVVRDGMYALAESLFQEVRNQRRRNILPGLQRRTNARP